MNDLDTILTKRLLTHYSGEHIGLLELTEKKKLYTDTIHLFKQMKRKDLYDKMIGI